MEKIIIILALILSFLVFYVFIVVVLLSKTSKSAKKKENDIIESFYNKLNKIPALIEIMKKNVTNSDVFEEVIYLHKLGIIYNIKSVYDILDLNNRIQKEFSFLMKISSKTPALHKNGNFLYIRDYIIFYESNIEKGIEEYNLEAEKYNKFIQLKNASLLGFIVPIQEKIVI